MALDAMALVGLLGRMILPHMGKRSLRGASCWVLGLLFIAAGANHFRVPDFYLPMMPVVLPAPRALIAISGIFEILGGIGVLIPRTRHAAGIGLILLLIAVFPANLEMARHLERMPSMHVSPLVAWLRLPLQGVLILWVWWSTRLVRVTTPERQSATVINAR